MEIKVTRTVPGFVEGRTLNAGDVADLSEGAAVSLINDGYAEVSERSVPAAKAEKATAPRGRK